MDQKNGCWSQLLLLKWLSLWFILMMNHPQTHDQMLVSIHTSIELWHTTVEMGGEEMCEVTQHVILILISGLQSSGDRQRDVMSSCVSQVTSVLKALEVGILQDAVDMQVGHWVRGLKRIAHTKRTAGALSTLTDAAPSCTFRTADAAAALTVGWLKCRYYITIRMLESRVCTSTWNLISYKVKQILL